MPADRETDELDLVQANLAAHEARITAIETWKSDFATMVAVREERDKHLDKRFDKLEQGVDDVKGYLLKIVWVIILGMIGSLVTFMMTGGLSGAAP